MIYRSGTKYINNMECHILEVWGTVAVLLFLGYTLLRCETRCLSIELPIELE